MRHPILLIFIACSLQSFGQANTKTYSNSTYQELKTRLWKISTSKEDLTTKRLRIFHSLADIFTQYPADERNYSFLLDAINLSLPQVDSLTSLIDTSLSRSPFRGYAMNIRKRITITETGKRFPALTLKDTLGKELVIDSLKGKVVLIDAWSSWCKPCRMQIPGLVKLYKKYHEKGFEMIGVSLNKDKDSWLKAIADDKQSWPHYSELVDWGSNKFASRFFINAIPANYLIDKDGTILGIDLSEEEIGRILKNQL